jgi:hypothetical protein
VSMTKKLHVTDLREIKALKITCTACGAGYITPVDAKLRPALCHNCGTAENTGPVWDLMRAIANLNATRLPYRVEFETGDGDWV